MQLTLEDQAKSHLGNVTAGKSNEKNMCPPSHTFEGFIECIASHWVKDHINAPWCCSLHTGTSLLKFRQVCRRGTPKSSCLLWYSICLCIDINPVEIAVALEESECLSQPVGVLISSPCNADSMSRVSISSEWCRFKPSTQCNVLSAQWKLSRDLP